MDLTTNIIIFVISLAILIKSADYFIDSAEKIGKWMKIPPFIIGLTIVALGTSLPELITCLIAINQHSTEIVLGNVIGSNIANVLLIMGVCGLFTKSMKIKWDIFANDLPMFFASGLLLFFVCWPITASGGGEKVEQLMDPFRVIEKQDETIRIWNTQDIQCRHILKGHFSRVNRVCYSPDGKFIASASNDNTVRIWNTQNGKCLHILKGHSSWVNRVCYSPDGKFIASASGEILGLGDDNTVRIWDTQNGQCIHILEGQTTVAVIRQKYQKLE